MVEGAEHSTCPFLAGFPDGLLGVVLLLQHGPLLGKEALQKILPAYLVLLDDGPLNRGGEALVVDALACPPLPDAVEQGFLDSWVGFEVFQLGLELLHGFCKEGISIVARAFEDMLPCLMQAGTSGAAGMGGKFPVCSSDSYASMPMGCHFADKPCSGSF